MLIVKIELHSAITGEVSEIGRLHICNIGGTAKRGDYEAGVLRRGGKGRYTRTGKVSNYPRLSYNVWRLVIRSLLSCFPEEKRHG